MKSAISSSTENSLPDLKNRPGSLENNDRKVFDVEMDIREFSQDTPVSILITLETTVISCICYIYS